MLLQKFREEVDSYIEEHGMSRSAFGAAAMNDVRFVFRLHEPNANPTVTTIDRVREFMDGA